MDDYFLSAAHGERYARMAMEDGMRAGDSERASLFYIIAGNDDLYEKRKSIYDMEGHCIRDCVDGKAADFSSGARSLVRLGFNLYNGWSDEHTTPISIMSRLDSENRTLAAMAIIIRFERGAPSRMAK